MAVFETSRALSEGVRTNGSTPVSRLRGAIMAWNDRRMTRKALASLSARELDDIGLSATDLRNL